MIGIYKITNIVNNKCYIGQSNNVEKRIQQHKDMLNNNCHNAHLQASYNKYGIENFTFELIEECPVSDLCKRERYWISFYRSNESEYGYNLTSGGENEPGWQQNSEVKEKISTALKKNNPMKNSDVAYRANSLREWKPESRKKISEANSKIYINNGSVHIRIKRDELDKYLEEGWKRGSLIKRSGIKNSQYGKKGELSSHYGNIAMTNGETTKYAKSDDDIKRLESEGFHIGKSKNIGRSISISKCDIYRYNDMLFAGSIRLRNYLNRTNYPRISQNTIYKISDGIKVSGYEDLKIEKVSKDSINIEDVIFDIEEVIK